MKELYFAIHVSTRKIYRRVKETYPWIDNYIKEENERERERKIERKREEHTEREKEREEQR